MRVSQLLILVPVFAQVLLTFVILCIMGWTRSACLRDTKRQMQDVALATATDWDDRSRKCANSYANQFELPVLFYAVCAFAMITRMVDIWMLVLAAGFVVSRYAHAAVHLTSNTVSLRFAFFIVGFVVLVAMWTMLAVRVIAAGF